MKGDGYNEDTLVEQPAIALFSDPGWETFDAYTVIGSALDSPFNGCPLFTRDPEYLIDTGGVYCDGYTWYNSSGREYKKDIKELTGDEAMSVLEGLSPVKFRFKKDPEDRHLGFISEDVPELAATRDRKGMSPMDVVAVLTKVAQEQEKLIQEQKRILKEQQNAIGELSTKVPAPGPP